MRSLLHPVIGVLSLGTLEWSGPALAMGTIVGLPGALLHAGGNVLPRFRGQRPLAWTVSLLCTLILILSQWPPTAKRHATEAWGVELPSGMTDLHWHVDRPFSGVDYYLRFRTNGPDLDVFLAHLRVRDQDWVSSLLRGASDRFTPLAPPRWFQHPWHAHRYRRELLSGRVLEVWRTETEVFLLDCYDYER